MLLKNTKISHKIILVISLAALLPLSVVALYSNTKSSEATEDRVLASMDFMVREVSSNIQSFINTAKQDVIFLHNTPPLQGIIRAIESDNSGWDTQGSSGYDQWVQRLTSIFSNFGKARPYYLQLRYLNNNGDEIIRLNFKEEHLRVVPQRELQNKAQSPYFIETMKLASGQVYVSPFNLNREAGQIENPNTPVVRVGTPMFSSTTGQRHGALILNIRGQDILKYIPKKNKSIFGDFFMLNKDGYFLYHDDDTKTWGFELDQPNNVFEDILGFAMPNKDNIKYVESADQIMTYALVHPDPNNKSYHWMVMNVVPHSVVMSASKNFQQILYFLAGIWLLVAIVMGTWLSQSWFIKPLNSILIVLNSFSKGDLHMRLNNLGSDEIGTVGKAFNRMAQLQEEGRQREQEQAKRERHQLQELEQFAYITSHDLKSPLRGISNLATWTEEILVEKELFDGEIKEHMTLLQKRVLRLDALLDDLLIYTKAGKKKEIALVDSKQLVMDLIDFFQNQDLDLHVKIQDDLPTFTTQKIALELVFHNLIKNAIKHHDRTEINLEISVKENDEFYIFSVRDDGPGIAPKYHENIFQLFKTLKPRDEVEGSGIGLTITKKLVCGLGGEIRVESQTDKRGTTFIFDWKKNCIINKEKNNENSSMHIDS